MRGGVLLAAAVSCCALLRCGGTSKSGNDPVTPQADAGDPGADGGMAGACAASALEDPRVATTYYVAIEQPGADNDRCDGLSPSDQGGGHCPFKDFSSERIRKLLDQTKSVRLAIRAGVYQVPGWEGIRVTGTGTSEAERVVLSSYAGEKAVLDVADPEGATCKGVDAANVPPTCVREVVRVSGTYTMVQGLTIQNGLAFDVEVTGGEHHVVRCNVLTHTSGWVSSDSLKLDGQARDIHVHHNELTRWRSQAIDITGVSDVLVEENDFHHPLDEDGGASGSKFGARNVTYRKNRVHDLGTSGQTHAFSLGGTGTPHPDDFEAYGVHVVENQVFHARGIFAQVVACDGCSVERNDVSDLGAGILVSAAGTKGTDCSASPTGCNASRKTKISGNRMRRLDGNGDPKQANLFVWVETGEGSELTVGDNLYCPTATADARFGWGAQMTDFAGWQQASGTDGSSKVLPAADPACTGW